MNYLLIFFGLLFLFFFAMILIHLNKNTYQHGESGFSQAGVTVSNVNKTINIKGSIYNIEKVKSFSFKSGLGPRGNISHAFINVSDLHKPVHKVEFITPGAAETFVNRLAVAVENAGGPSFRVLGEEEPLRLQSDTGFSHRLGR